MIESEMCQLKGTKRREPDARQGKATNLGPSSTGLGRIGVGRTEPQD